MKGFFWLTKVIAFMGVVFGCGLTASAEPALQLYLEGATYNTTTETWMLDDTSSPARLWVIGNVDVYGPILDVRLAVAYDSALNLSPLTPLITPSTTGGYMGFADGTTPAAPTHIKTVTDGSRPLLSDGTPLGPHGVYGPQTDWQEFYLGHFSETTWAIGDFQPPPDMPIPGPHVGQINVYEFDFTGLSGVGFHFDVYNHLEGDNRAVFGPFSHDAGIVPAPGAALLGVIGLGMVGWVRRRMS